MNRNLPLDRAVQDNPGLKTFPNWAGPLKACLGRIHRWHAPSNWSLQEWSDELDSVARLAAVEAARTFDPERGVSFDTFIRSRVLARTLTFCRREWAYATRHFDGFSFPEDQEKLIAGRGVFASDISSGSESDEETLRELLACLSPQDVWLLEELYLFEHSEAELARLLRISQRAVNKRKHVALGKVRRDLNRRSVRACNRWIGSTLLSFQAIFTCSLYLFGASDFQANAFGILF